MGFSGLKNSRSLVGPASRKVVVAKEEGSSATSRATRASSGSHAGMASKPSRAGGPDGAPTLPARESAARLEARETHGARRRTAAPAPSSFRRRASAEEPHAAHLVVSSGGTARRRRRLRERTSLQRELGRQLSESRWEGLRESELRQSLSSATGPGLASVWRARRCVRGRRNTPRPVNEGGSLTPRRRAAPLASIRDRGSHAPSLAGIGLANATVFYKIRRSRADDRSTRWPPPPSPPRRPPARTRTRAPWRRP